ncbi:MAG: septal ring lytic transglycosylase RlpA family protein [Hyphomicrobiales bacterium]
MNCMSTLRIAGIAAAAALAFTFSQPATPASAAVQCGKASWYAMTTLTASGERANPEAMVAAHKSLPFGTSVQVRNLDNGRSITVRINDRGPFIRGRIIDLSRLAAARLGFKDQGVTRVCVTTRG